MPENITNYETTGWGTVFYDPLVPEFDRLPASESRPPTVYYEFGETNKRIAADFTLTADPRPLLSVKLRGTILLPFQRAAATIVLSDVSWRGDPKALFEAVTGGLATGAGIDGEDDLGPFEKEITAAAALAKIADISRSGGILTIGMFTTATWGDSLELVPGEGPEYRGLSIALEFGEKEGPSEGEGEKKRERSTPRPRRGTRTAQEMMGLAGGYGNPVIPNIPGRVSTDGRSREDFLRNIIPDPHGLPYNPTLRDRFDD